MKITFRIHPDAATFIRRNKLRAEDGREMVLQLYAFHQLPQESAPEIRTLEQATKFAEANMAVIPPNAVFRWAVGSNFRESVPNSDIQLVDGIPFHLPEDINQIIGDRELVLDNGRLRFEPDFEPFSKLPLDKV
jgi:hypothetical protein